MTQKEKAEAYDKAIEIIKGNLNALNEITETGANVVNIQSIKNCFYRAFPNLCESEDDNIKSCIGMCLTDADKQRFDDYNITLKDCLDWLEKQGEQKSTWNKEDERICQCLIRDQEESLDDVCNDKYGHSEIISDLKETYSERINWLESLKERLKGE